MTTIDSNGMMPVSKVNIVKKTEQDKNDPFVQNFDLDTNKKNDDLDNMNSRVTVFGDGAGHLIAERIDGATLDRSQYPPKWVIERYQETRLGPVDFNK